LNTKLKICVAAGAIAFGLSAISNADAQWFQNPQVTPNVPGCAPGTSWVKNGVRYECESAAPSCQFGFASGPVWTGTSWSYSCNGPPTQPGGQGGQSGGNQGASDPITLCASMAASQGITLIPSTLTQASPFTKNGQAATLRGFIGTGPAWSENGSSGNEWQIFCANFDATGQFIPAGSQPGPFSVQPLDLGCPGCGGGT
jgi:hypothetical protein